MPIPLLFASLCPVGRPARSDSHSGFCAAARWVRRRRLGRLCLPSALLLVLFAFGAAVLGGPMGSGIVHGLKVVAVAIVAWAVWGEKPLSRSRAGKHRTWRGADRRFDGGLFARPSCRDRCQRVSGPPALPRRPDVDRPSPQLSCLADIQGVLSCPVLHTAVRIAGLRSLFTRACCL